MKLYFIVLLACVNGSVFAQKKTTELLFKDFVNICNSYKNLPLQLKVEYKKTSNIYTNNMDTNIIQGVFNIQKEGAYIHFGKVEQIVNDSFALAVMEDAKLMVLSENNIGANGIVNNMFKSPINDSSIDKLAKKYSISKRIVDNKTAVLLVVSKTKLYKSDIVKEQMEVWYNIKTMEPEKLITITRSLTKKSKDIINGKELSAVVITIPEKGEFFVKEEMVNLMYKSIEHNVNNKLPINMSDRIVRDDTKNFVPVKAYENYNLKFN